MRPWQRDGCAAAAWECEIVIVWEYKSARVSKHCRLKRASIEVEMFIFQNCDNGKTQIGETYEKGYG